MRSITFSLTQHTRRKEYLDYLYMRLLVKIIFILKKKKINNYMIQFLKLKAVPDTQHQYFSHWMPVRKGCLGIQHQNN